MYTDVGYPEMSSKPGSKILCNQNRGAPATGETELGLGILDDSHQEVVGANPAAHQGCRPQLPNIYPGHIHRCLLRILSLSALNLLWYVFSVRLKPKQKYLTPTPNPLSCQQI